MADRSENHRPLAFWFRDCPTDEQIRADVIAALADPRVSEALKLLRATTPGVPFATAIAAVFGRWDELPMDNKVRSLAEMMGWELSWPRPEVMHDNLAAWETPWDDFREPTPPAADASTD